MLAAGLNGARFREDSKETSVEPGKLFTAARDVELFPGLALEGLPNRDSLQFQGMMLGC